MSLENFMSSDPLSHLAVTDWDKNFLSNADYRAWLHQELKADPIRPQEALAEYVDRRTNHFSSASQQPQATTSSASLDAFGSAPGSLAPHQVYVNPSQLSPQDAMSPYANTNGTSSLSVNPAAMMAGPSSTHSPAAAPSPAPQQPSKTLMVRNQKPRSNSPAVPSPFGSNIDSPDAPSPAPVASTSAAADPNAAAAANESWKRIRPQVIQQLEACNSKFVVRSANTLAKCLHPFSDSSSPSTMVPAEGRREVLDTLLKRATKDFYQALVGSEKGRDVFESWCRDAVTAGKKGSYNGALLDTLKPCLQLLKNMPYKYEEVTSSKLGLPKVLSGVLKKENYPADCRELAKELVEDWKGTFRSREQAQQAKQEDAKRKGGAANLEDARKKRKISPPIVTTKPAPPPKVAASAAAPKPSLNNILGNKANGGALKSLSIGKGGTGAPGPSSAPSSKPAAGSFASILASLTGSSASKDKDNTAQKANNAAGTAATGSSSVAQATPAAGGTKKGTGLLKRPGASNYKKKKSVRWKEGDELEAVREIEPAFYGEDHMEGRLDLHVMEANEGKLMSHRVDEEKRPWIEPPAIALPPSDDPQQQLYPPTEPLFPLGQPEAVTRLQEDSGAMDLDGDPDEQEYFDSPAEPPESELTPTDRPSFREMQNADSMLSDPDYQEAYRRAHPPLADVIRSSVVNDLLAQMQRTQAQDFSRPPPAVSSYPYGSDARYGNRYPSQYEQPHPHSSAERVPPSSSMKASSQRKQEESGGRNVPFKRTPCTFYAQGKCTRGDSCTFVH